MDAKSHTHRGWASAAAAGALLAPSIALAVPATAQTAGDGRVPNDPLCGGQLPPASALDSSDLIEQDGSDTPENDPEGQDGQPDGSADGLDGGPNASKDTPEDDGTDSTDGAEDQPEGDGSDEPEGDGSDTPEDDSEGNDGELDGSADKIEGPNENPSGADTPDREDAEPPTDDGPLDVVEPDADGEETDPEQGAQNPDGEDASLDREETGGQDEPGGDGETDPEGNPEQPDGVADAKETDGSDSTEPATDRGETDPEGNPDTRDKAADSLEPQEGDCATGDGSNPPQPPGAVPQGNINVLGTDGCKVGFTVTADTAGRLKAKNYNFTVNGKSYDAYINSGKVLFIEQAGTYQAVLGYEGQQHNVADERATIPKKLCVADKNVKVTEKAEPAEPVTKQPRFTG